MSDDVSLREQKYAANRLALLDAMLKRLEDTPFEDIKIRDLCRDVTISEATFYNYFPKKTDLLYYFIQLWSIEVFHFAQHSGAKSAYEKLSLIFSRTAEDSGKNPRVMSEIIVFQARKSETPEIRPISEIERRLAFPELKEIETIPDRGLDSILPTILSEAIERKELPANSDLDVLILGVASIFFGVPLLLADKGTLNLINKFYKKELNIFWKGAGGILPSGKKLKV